MVKPPPNTMINNPNYYPGHDKIKRAKFHIIGWKRYQGFNDRKPILHVLCSTRYCCALFCPIPLSIPSNRMTKKV